MSVLWNKIWICFVLDLFFDLFCTGYLKPKKLSKKNEVIIILSLGENATNSLSEWINSWLKTFPE